MVKRWFSSVGYSLEDLLSAARGTQRKFKAAAQELAN